MALLPIAKTLDNKTLTTSACHLYRASIVKVLPISVLLAIGILYIKMGAQFFPEHLKHFHLQSAMFLIVILFPLAGMIFKLIDNVGKGTPMTYLAILILACQKFISLAGALISMLLVPFIVLGLGIAVFFLMIKFHLPTPFFIAWKVLLFLLVYACFVTKLFAPSLVITDLQDANDAIDQSDLLVKHYYWRTFVQGLQAVLLIVVLAKLPSLITPFIKGVNISPFIIESISCALLALLGPWSFAVLLVNQSELQWRKREKVS